MLNIMKSDIEYMREKYGVNIIAWCTDDGPDGKKGRRLLKTALAFIIAIVCWAHQINLVVGDYLGLKHEVLESVPMALEVIKWFNNHGYALDLLRQQQRLNSEHILSLILPCVTRWTAHYLAISRLLKVSKAVKTCCFVYTDKVLDCAANTLEAKAKAQEIVDTVSNNRFWENLTK